MRLRIEKQNLFSLYSDMSKLTESCFAYPQKTLLLDASVVQRGGNFLPNWES